MAIAAEVADSVWDIDMGSKEPAAEGEARACRGHSAQAFHAGKVLRVAPVTKTDVDSWLEPPEGACWMDVKA